MNRLPRSTSHPQSRRPSKDSPAPFALFVAGLVVLGLAAFYLIAADESGEVHGFVTESDYSAASVGVNSYDATPALRGTEVDHVAAFAWSLCRESARIYHDDNGNKRKDADELWIQPINEEETGAIRETDPDERTAALAAFNTRTLRYAFEGRRYYDANGNKRKDDDEPFVVVIDAEEEERVAKLERDRMRRQMADVRRYVQEATANEVRAVEAETLALSLAALVEHGKTDFEKLTAEKRELLDRLRAKYR